MNSLKNIVAAIEYETHRQRKEHQKIQETRMYDEKKLITIRMRTKEQAEDYRFISDPDLPVIKITKTRIDNLKSSLPETPEKKLEKLIKKHKIDSKTAEVLVKNLEIVEFFEKIVEKIPSRLAVPWVTVELLRFLNYNKKTIDSPDIEINPEHFIELLKLIEDKKITELKAKEILNKFYPKSFSPLKEAEKQGKISSSDKIEKFAKQVIKNNAKAVSDFKQGQQNALNFLIGQLMTLSNKRADFKISKIILEKLIFDDAQKFRK